MAGCLDKQTLAALANGSLSEAQAAAAEAHLEKCRRCAEALAHLPVNDALIADIRELEQSREEIGSALAELREVEARVSTTLFGRESH